MRIAAGIPTKDGHEASVWLHGSTNVILRFTGPSMDEPFLWGFASVREWRDYLKMLLRFDEGLGEQSPEPADEGDRGY